MSYLKLAREVFDSEISGLAFVKENLGEEFNQAIDKMLLTKGRVVITGMGKSGLVGKKIAATLASTGTRSFFIHPGEAYHGDLGMISPHDVVIAISNSGETEEVIKLISFFQDNKNTIISMTGKENSTLAKYSDIFLNINVQKEACPLELAPTTSTTVTMAYGDALAVALMKARNFKEENFARFHPGGSLGKKLLLTVADVMRKDNLPLLDKGSSFSDILSKIADGRMGIAVVVEGAKIIGVITDGDIRRVIAEENEKALSLLAHQICSNKPKTISPTEKIVKAEAVMQEFKINSILVTSEDNLVGIIDRYSF